MLVDLASQPSAAAVGAKAARLGWLMGHGWAVPAGVVAPFDVTERLAASNRPVDTEALRSRLAEWVDPARHYAVRSSANAEDHGARSFAGQFISVLDVVGVDDVLAAMREVATSLGAPRVSEYARLVGVDPASLRMAVIVQQMVPATVAGVAFSRDPVDGSDRVVVEAVLGRGELLVARGATPQRWVHGPSGPMEAPVDPVLPADAITEIIGTVRAVEEASGDPADIEWVWDRARLSLVQWRPITGLTDRARVWSSRMARDMLPGLIPPLVWSVNVPVLSRVWVELVDHALGPTGLDPGDLVRSFGYRAYFNVAALGSVFGSLGLPPDALERMRAGTGHPPMRPSTAAMLHRAPRLIRFAYELSTWPRRARAQVREVERARRQESAEDPSRLVDDALLARVDRLCLLLGSAARLNVVTPLLADAWATSMRRAAARHGLDPATVDPGQELAAVRDLDPAHALALLDPGDDAGWKAFLDRFGHLSDSPNDCSQPTWAERPDVVRRLVGGRAARLADAPAARPRTALLARAPLWQRPLVAAGWSTAAALRLAREHVGYTYARVYAMFRPTFLEIGRRLVERQAITAPDDVFLLTLEEVRAALGGALPDASTLVAQRRDDMAEAADLSWPDTIIGDDPVPVRGRAGARTLRGVPTSGGRHTGTARVVTSLASAPAIGPEDVLVLEAADVTWTPLLLRAGAVVTETGGMLSHASIVARELGLPCVASVGGATRIADGARVYVDGGSGEVLVLDGEVDR